MKVPSVIRESQRIELVLNGSRTVVEKVLPAERLSQTLRERLAAREVKVGCDAGDCGACSVLMDGELVCACLTPTHQARNRHVMTSAGIIKADPTVAALVSSFLRHGSAQCGICTPGMIVSAAAMSLNGGTSNEEAIKGAMGGVLCRCTGYRQIIDGVSGVTDAHGPDISNPDIRIGNRLSRVDGMPKITGLEEFGDDIAPADALVIKVIRCPFARAEFEFGDLDKFVASDIGIEAVLTADDISGENRFGIFPDFVDQPVFAEHEARFRGEAVAAVVGSAQAMWRFGAEQFPVRWKELLPVFGIEEAVAEEAIRLHQGRAGNLLCKGRVERGNVNGALELAEIVVEGKYTTSFVEHAYIEPEAGYAYLEGGRVVVHACTQAPHMDLDSLQRILGTDRGDIRVVPTAVGGGFGSKLDLSVQPYLALAALKTGKKVRIAYTRSESMQSTTKRHPGHLKMTIGADRTGKIKGAMFEGAFNTGAYASWGPAVVSRVPVHASGPYFVPHYLAKTRAILTNCPPSGAFRGFGVPQSAVAIECLMDELAEQLGMDAVEFRVMNCLENGMQTVCGQVFEQGVGIKSCLEAIRDPWKSERELARQFNETQERMDGFLRRGVGIAAGWYGCGNTAVPNPSTIKCGVRSDGTVVLHQGAVDIGQGSNTVILQIFAEALGINEVKIELVGADTDITPDAGKTSASRQTYISGNAAKLCAEQLRSEIARKLNVAADARMWVDQGRIFSGSGEGSRSLRLSEISSDDEDYVLRTEASYDPPILPLDSEGQGEPYAQFGYAVQLALVEVDTGLGTVKAQKFVAAHDVGKAINPTLVEGQILGGIAQGLGMALMEEFLPEKTDNLHDYLIPTFGDIPPVETIIIEEPDAHGPFGAKGLGEHVLIPTTPAILNGIYDACGVRIRDIPATPSRVLLAIKAKADG